LSSKRRRPFNLPLIDEAETSALTENSVSGGRSYSGRLDQSGESVAFRARDLPLTIDQVRKDDMNMFVNRDDEDKFVVSLHFPVTHGRARQFKITAWIRESVHRDSRGVLRVDEERQFDDQALADFEQISVNFIMAALPALRNSAYFLSRLKPEHALPIEPEERAEYRDDGLKEYIVNVDGWPLTRRRFRLHDVVRLFPGHVTRDVESGYLVRVDTLEPHEIADGTLFGQIIAAYRKNRAEDLSWRRPPPTDPGLLATTEGRKVREQIVAAFAEIVDAMFPPLPGAPIKVAERTALLSEYEILKAKHSDQPGRAKRELMAKYGLSLTALEKKLTRARAERRRSGGG
jgi:hypothetical protein